MGHDDRLEGLRTVIYPAHDLDAATSWWSEVLGADPYFAEPFYVGYDVGGYELGAPPERRPARWGLGVLGLADVADSVAAAMAAGATEHAPVTTLEGAS